MFNIFVDNFAFVLFLLRVVVGAIFIWHGLPKFRKPDGMAESLGWPRSAVMALGALEILAGLGVIFGAFLQLSALFMAATMLGAIYHKIFKWKTGFWSHTGTGWEFDLLILVCTLVIMAQGPESYSLLPY